MKKCEQERALAVAELEKSNAQVQFHSIQQLLDTRPLTVCQVRDLKAENVRLRRNISALFKTAQLELSRTHAMLADARRSSAPASASEAKQAPAKRPRVDALPPAP